MKIIQFYLKWVHMAPCDLILGLDGAQRLRIISKPLLTPQQPMKDQQNQNESKMSNLTSYQVHFVAGCRQPLPLSTLGRKRVTAPRW